MSASSIADRIALRRAQIVADAAKAAKRKPAAATAKAPLSNPTPSPAPALNPQTDTQHLQSNPARKSPKEPLPKNKTGKTDRKPALVLAKSSEIDHLWALFELPPHPPEVVALIGPKLRPMLDAILAGAAKPGVQGQGDRLTLGKMLGARWARPAQVQAADLGAAAAAIGDRISRAIARRETHRGQVPVTLDGSTGREVADDEGFGQVAPLFREQVRSPAAALEGPRGRVADIEAVETEEDLLGGW